MKGDDFSILYFPLWITNERHSRYRQIPTFGRSTIRRFDNNTSALKKLAARNYEDALQVLFNSP